MNTIHGKRKPVNYFRNDDDLLKNENKNNPVEVDEITEVDDKLIGDDLDINQAQSVNTDENTQSENEENNY